MKKLLIVQALLLSTANVILPEQADTQVEEVEESIVTKLERIFKLLEQDYAEYYKAQDLIKRIKALIYDINENGLTKENESAASQIFLEKKEFIANLEAELDQIKWQEERERERERERDAEERAAEKAAKAMAAAKAQQEALAQSQPATPNVQAPAKADSSEFLANIEKANAEAQKQNAEFGKWMEKVDKHIDKAERPITEKVTEALSLNKPLSQQEESYRDLGFFGTFGN